MDKIKICMTFIILISFGFVSCNDKKTTPDGFGRVEELFKESPEIIPDSRDYSLVLEWTTDNVWNNEFKLTIVSSTEYLKYWKRRYQQQNIYEYRLFCYPENCHYIFGQGADSIGIYCFYIKWRQNRTFSEERMPKRDKYVLNSDIGALTTYLETNLSKSVILKFFPDVKCGILIKKPKRIIMDLNKIQPNMAGVDAFPQLEY